MKLIRQVTRKNQRNKEKGRTKKTSEKKGRNDVKPSVELVKTINDNELSQ